MARTEKQFKGDAGEGFVRLRYIFRNYQCSLEKQNNEGFDFIARKRLHDGSEEKIYVEVKAGFHGLSPAQKRKKQEVELSGEIYRHMVIYVPPIYYGKIMRELWPRGFRKSYFDG
jgi:hypothetical protein